MEEKLYFSRIFDEFVKAIMKLLKRNENVIKSVTLKYILVRFFYGQSKQHEYELNDSTFPD